MLYYTRDSVRRVDPQEVTDEKKYERAIVLFNRNYHPLRAHNRRWYIVGDPLRLWAIVV